MTHNDIYTKFMIEYDKANVTSSYPSLTEYEVATVLDKAYNALIALKFTGNNIRRVQFEQDVKNIEDLRPLITTVDKDLMQDDVPALNVKRAKLNEDHLYFVSAAMRNTFGTTYDREIGLTDVGDAGIISGAGAKNNKAYVIKRQVGQNNFKLTSSIKFYEGVKLLYSLARLDEEYVTKIPSTVDPNNITLVNDMGDGPASLDDICNQLIDVSEDSYELFPYLVIWLSASSTYDYSTNVGNLQIVPLNGMPMDNILDRIIPVNIVNHKLAENFFITTYNLPWIKNPVAYIEDQYIYFVYDSYKQPNINSVLISYIHKPKLFVKQNLDDIKKLCGVGGEASYFWFKTNNNNSENITNEYYKFELSDTVAEELISLAISFALENIESPRLNNKLNMRGLEA